MNENPDLISSQPDSSPTRPNYGTRGRLTLLLGASVIGLLAVGFMWIWLAEPPRDPALLAGDRQRLEAFLAAHDYEAFLRLMELQPPAVRAELPAEWLRRYDEIKPALLFTVREASTEEVINSDAKYEVLLLSLRWSDDGKYLVDVLEPPSKRKVFDGRTGRLVSIAHEPTLLPESDAHWPLGQWDKSETRPKSVSDQLVRRLCFSFGHDQFYWQAQDNQWPVLLMPSPDNTDNKRMLTSFAVYPRDVEALKRGYHEDPLGNLHPIFGAGHLHNLNARKRCFNVWKGDAFPECLPTKMTEDGSAIATPRR